jgi:hypothetical protein
MCISVTEPWYTWNKTFSYTIEFLKRWLFRLCSSGLWEHGMVSRKAVLRMVLLSVYHFFSFGLGSISSPLPMRLSDCLVISLCNWTNSWYFIPEVGENMFLQNIVVYLQDYMVSASRRPHFEKHLHINTNKWKCGWGWNYENNKFCRSLLYIKKLMSDLLSNTLNI